MTDTFYMTFQFGKITVNIYILNVNPFRIMKLSINYHYPIFKYIKFRIFSGRK